MARLARVSRLPAAMWRSLALVVLAVAAVSCDRGASVTTATLPSATAAPTTADSDVCEDLADEAVDLVADIIDRLNDIDVVELTDVDAWDDDLVRLREQGTALDAEAMASGCAAGVIQAAVRESLADLETESRLAELLVSLLAP